MPTDTPSRGLAKTLMSTKTTTAAAHRTVWTVASRSGPRSTTRRRRLRCRRTARVVGAGTGGPRHPHPEVTPDHADEHGAEHVGPERDEVAHQRAGVVLDELAEGQHPGGDDEHDPRAHDVGDDDDEGEREARDHPEPALLGRRRLGTLRTWADPSGGPLSRRTSHSLPRGGDGASAPDDDPRGDVRDRRGDDDRREGRVHVLREARRAVGADRPEHERRREGEGETPPPTTAGRGAGRCARCCTTTITTGTTASIANWPTTMTATAPAAMAADRGRRPVVGRRAGDGDGHGGAPSKRDHCSRL